MSVGFLLCGRSLVDFFAVWCREVAEGREVPEEREAPEEGREVPDEREVPEEGREVADEREVGRDLDFWAMAAGGLCIPRAG
ncbi:hypothetical protein [Myxococcus eversor]|uniref:hypothetical protein n=1 Tax=Myxococcus eversor TaxID=2709661 RepID=UPI0013D1A2DB|nr:hypothetical protein [Myxococcus eversor]